MSSGKYWIILFVAGLFEVLWAFYLKQSEGFSKLIPSVAFVVTLGLSMALLAFSLRAIPLSLAYPVWTGIGAVGTVIAGVLWFGEPFSILKGFFVFLILAGIIGLKALP